MHDMCTCIVYVLIVQWVVSELGEEFIIDETQDGATPIHIAAGRSYHC